MSNQLSLSFFPTHSPNGIAFRDAFVQLAKRMNFKLKIPLNPTPLDVANACWNDDVVVFDGSIEDEGHNYSIAFEPLKGMRHALIISRTPLPLNFFGLRPGGSPDHPQTLSNEAILAWLAQELPSMQPRPWSEKGMLFQLAAQSHSLNWATQRRKEQGQIFVSYRSRYSRDVQQLQRQLQKGNFHQGKPKTMFFFPPGSLAFEDEIMSAMRRWQVLSIIRDYIIDCEEFWLYQTDDYLDSWWTRGELATFVYHGGAKRLIRIYNAKTGKVRDGSADDLPVQTKEEHNRMARWFANTDPTVMGAESAIILGELAQTPVGNLPFFNDVVWKEEFQHYPVMQCSSEQCNRKRREKGVTDLTFDMDGLLWMREDNLFPIGNQRIEQVVEEKKVIVCPRCNTPYRVRREALERYLYLALPVGKGSKGPNLQALPVYRAERV